jgi:hypothetical protein
MKIQTSTKARVNRQGEPEIWLTISLLPRGSGNRSKVAKLAEAARRDPDMSPWILRVVEGSSRLVVVLKPGFGLVGALNRVSERNRDVEGQLPLFAKPAAS